MVDRDKQADMVPRWRLWVSRVLWFSVGCSIISGTILHFLFLQIDVGTANVTAFVSGILATCSLLLLWVSHPRGNFGKRLILACIPILVGGVFLSFVEFRGFSGEMLPQFRWRSSSRNVPVASQSLDESASPADATSRTFSQLLGNDRNGVIAGVQLNPDWSSQPPRVLWNVACGESWAGIAVVDQKLVTLEQHDDEEWVTCRSVRDGSLLWKHVAKARHYNVLGGLGPRSTPTIVGDRVYTLGAVGHVACLDLASGLPHWTAELLAIAGTDQASFEQAVSWGYSASPLLVHDSVILPLGNASSALSHNLVALDAISGRLLWKGGNKQISYATPALGRLAGIECLVSVNEDTVTGHSPQNGDTLFEFPWSGASNGAATCSQPLFIGDDGLLVSKGYGIGSALLRFSAEGEQLKFSTAWRNAKELRTKFTSPVLDADHLYALSDGILECVRVSDGKRVWKEGRYGHGQVLLVGKHLLLTSESGELVLVEASPIAYKELGKIPVLDGITWNIPSLAGDLCFMKNSTSLACIQLSLVEQP